MLEMSLVCIDDEPDLLEVMKDNLELLVRDVEIFSDQSLALAHLAATTPNAVLMDYRMPVRDGIQLAQLISPAIPVLIVTGELEVPEHPRIAAVFYKPLDFDALEAYLASLASA